MLHAAVPAEGVYVPEHPSQAQRRIDQQVLPHSAFFGHPQRDACPRDKHQRHPDPGPQEKRIEEKAYKKVSHQQNFADAQRFPVIDRKLLSGLGDFLMQKVREKFHWLYLPCSFLSLPIIMHHPICFFKCFFRASAAGFRSLDCIGDVH